MAGLVILGAGFLLLFVLARAVENQQLEFYQAAFVLAIVWTFLSPLLTIGQLMFDWRMVSSFVVNAVAGLVLFALLRRFEDTMALWLLTFVVGGFIFIQVL